MPAVQTIATIQDIILKTFPRSYADAETILVSQFDQWIGLLCRHFPWWVTTIYPGDLSASFPLTLSSVTKLAGDWIHRGWFVTTAGQETYILRAPYDDGVVDESTDWHQAEVQQVMFLHAFSEKGDFRFELEGNTPHQLNRATSYSHTQGEPVHYWLDTIPGESGLVSALRLHPTPSEVKLYQCCFALAACPSYTVSANDYNRFVTYESEVVVLYCLMKLARYFNEPELYENYREELFGNPPKGNKYGVEVINGGLLGDLKESSNRRHRDYSQRLPYTTHAGQSVGPRRNRWLGRGRYWRGGSPYP